MAHGYIPEQRFVLIRLEDGRTSTYRVGQPGRGGDCIIIRAGAEGRVPKAYERLRERKPAREWIGGGELYFLAIRGRHIGSSATA